MGKNKTNGLPKSLYEMIYLPPQHGKAWDVSDNNFFERMKKDGGKNGKTTSGQSKQNRTKS
tara:strand:+ start:2818 stop:3000 length:183 start_codon:yes stop_codon:yes gene_type:complete